MIKQSINRIVLLLCVAGLFSCQDYLEVDSPSQISTEQTFNDVDNAEAALVAIYGALIGDDAYGNRISNLYPNTTDEFKVSGDYNCNDRRGISMYGPCATNPELDKPFQQLYSGIERANLAIKYIPESEVFSSGTDAEKKNMNQFYGEALSLRAQFYYELIRNWGDVPFQDVPASDIEDLFLPKTDRDTIYEQIIADLGEATEYVPWGDEASIPSTRFSKGAVKALRARISLARAGYSLRRDPVEMKQGSNPEKYYQIAYDETKSIIESGKYRLNPSYEEVFRGLAGSGSTNKQEMILEVGAFGGNSKTDSKLGYFNGLRHDNASKWKGGGGLNAIPTYFYEFDRNDVRRDVTINVFSINAEEQTELVRPDQFTDGKFRKSWTTITGPSQNLGYNWPLIRYADVLLMFAEADNELNNGPSQDAMAALRAVRNRAIPNNESSNFNISGDKQLFFKTIVKERLFEFGGEGIRKYDLIRWNLLDEILKETREKLVDFQNGKGPYSDVPEFIYYKPGNYDPSSSAQETVDNLDLFFSGNDKSSVFYNTTPENVPSDFKRVSWRDGIKDEYIDSERKGYAQYFEPNHSELLPIYQGILNNNNKLTQDYGY